MHRPRSIIRPHLILVTAGLALGLLIASACWNETESRNVYAGGGRFEIVPQPSSSEAIVLLDTATGDTWSLDRDGGRWIRFASGPADVRPLRRQELLADTPGPDPE
jgi:hypothetical protein